MMPERLGLPQMLCILSCLGIFALAGCALSTSTPIARSVSTPSVESFGKNTEGPQSGSSLTSDEFGEFTYTAPPLSDRRYHTATLLQTGQVLIVGGTSYEKIHGGTRVQKIQLGSAELYTPTRGTFESAEALSQSVDNGPGRSNHTATLLSNGKVLVVGGGSADTYDPATGSWTGSTGGMLQGPRGLHTATLLRDGKVLVAGGFHGIQFPRPTETAELYDPVTDSWASAGQMSTARRHHAAIMLEDGRVLVTGGRGWSSDLTSAEIYDPVTGSWTLAANTTEGHMWPVAIKLQDGKILVAGGYTETAELYDPATNTWSPAGRMAKYRVLPTATLLQDGRVLVVGSGGDDRVRAPTSDLAELFIPETKTWVAIGTMTTTRAGATATMLPNGTVLVVGGNAPITDDIPAATAELYFPFRK